MPEMGTMQQINSEPLRTATVLTPQSQAEQYAREAQQAAAQAAQSATDAQTAAESAQQAVAGAVKYSEAQTLTAAQQAQARENIGAVDTAALAIKQDAPAIAGTEGQVLTIDDQGDPIWATPTDAVSRQEFDALAEDVEELGDTAEAHEQYAEETYAKQDGYYQDMTVGNAEQLVATKYVEDSESYLYRTSGGSADIGNREYMDAIVGGTVAWNQLLSELNLSAYATTIKTITPQKVVLTPNGAHSTTLHYGASIMTSSLNAIPLNHMLFVCVDCMSTKDDKFRVRIGDSMFWSASVSANTKVHINAIAPFVTDTLTAYAYDDTLYSTADEITFQNWNIFDLTQMFGPTIADYIYSLETATPGAGVAWFRKLFPADYYDYNPGELLSVEGLQSHDMVGFNQWDEEWEAGTISAGNPIPASNAIRSKNFCPCIGGATYYMTCGKTDGGNQNKYYLAMVFYDSNKKYIWIIYNNNGTAVAPSNARFFKITTNASAVIYGNTYNHDICINLSLSGAHNGEYAPYEKHSYPLDSSLTLRGIPKLDSANKLYWDGDEYKPDGTVTRKYGIVDLGTLSWENNGENSVFANVLQKKVGSKNVFCDKLVYSPAQSISTVPYNGFRTYDNSNGIALRISGINTDNVLGIVSGMMLVYELATPTTETADPYQQTQIVNDWGTEEFVSTSIVPVGHETRYPANLRDKLQHLPDLAGENGYYMIQQSDSEMSLIKFRIPQAPAESGTYILKATVVNGSPTYTWEVEA